MSQIESFTAALEVVQPREVNELYWMARPTLVSSQRDLAAFDAIFKAVFDEAVQPGDPIAKRMAGPPPVPTDKSLLAPGVEAEDTSGPSLPWATRPTVVATDETAEVDDRLAIDVPERRPSELDPLIDTPFDLLGAEDAARIGEWLTQLLIDWPQRRTRRFEGASRGQHLALRPTLARSRRTGYEPVRLVRRRPVHRRRRVVMLCDVSQSMQAYASAYLAVMRALVLAADAEVFAFSTGLTRLTPALRHKSTAQAIQDATEAVEDRFGGTRIARSLSELLNSHHGGLTRGAVVLIASDGWDVDPPEDMERAMARLARRAHHVVWINPRMAADDFQPLVGSMAAALPHCDQVFAGHTIRTLTRSLNELRPVGSKQRVRSVRSGARSR